MILYSFSALAIEENDVNFNGGVGYAGSRGVVGFSVDRFYTPNHALSVAFGADFVGATSTVGYKYFTEKTNNSGTVWDKCLFIFDCDTHAYFGGSAQYAGKTTLKVSENGVEQRAYDIDPKWLAIASMGLRTVYKSNMTLDLELSYRSIFAGGKSMQTYGAPVEDEYTEVGFRTLGANAAIGYMF